MLINTVKRLEWIPAFEKNSQWAGPIIEASTAHMDHNCENIDTFQSVIAVLMHSNKTIIATPNQEEILSLLRIITKKQKIKKSPAYKDIIVSCIEAIIQKEQYGLEMSQTELSTIFPTTMETICCLIDNLCKLKCFTNNEKIEIVKSLSSSVWTLSYCITMNT